MTRLEALLERAAEAQPVTFDAGDVRRRVRTRRRVRRTASAFVAVALVAGVFGVAHENGRHRVEPAVGEVTPSLVGRWIPVSINGQSLDARRRVLLEQLQTEIDRQEDIINRLGPGAELDTATNTLLQLNILQAQLQTREPRIDFHRDETFDGVDDVCGPIAGRWHVDDERLSVVMSRGGGCTQPLSPTPLVQVLRADPTVRAGDEPETLQLSSSVGDATLRRSP
jgi:hypothetical protein